MKFEIDLWILDFHLFFFCLWIIYWKPITPTPTKDIIGLRHTIIVIPSLSYEVHFSSSNDWESCEFFPHNMWPTDSKEYDRIAVTKPVSVTFSVDLSLLNVTSSLLWLIALLCNCKSVCPSVGFYFNHVTHQIKRGRITNGTKAASVECNRF